MYIKAIIAESWIGDDRNGALRACIRSILDVAAGFSQGFLRQRQQEIGNACCRAKARLGSALHASASCLNRNNGTSRFR